MTKKIEITLTRSLIGRKQDQRQTVQALGLRKMNQTVAHEVNPAILGMVQKVSHLVTVKEI